jgi:hypothetical protein
MVRCPVMTSASPAARRRSPDKNVGSAKTVTGTGFSLSGADKGNYTLKSSTLTTTSSITAKQLTVTAENKSKVYGAANPTFTVSYGGFVDGDSAASLGGTLAFDTNATASSPVGSYDVTPRVSPRTTTPSASPGAR